MNAPRQKRKRKNAFVRSVPRLLDLVERVEIKTTVIYDWTDERGERWAVVVFNDTPYLACAKDIP